MDEQMHENTVQKGNSFNLTQLHGYPSFDKNIKRC